MQDVDARARGGAAFLVLLLPREHVDAFAQTLAPGVSASQGAFHAAIVDATAEPDAAGRFGLTGAPAVVLFIGGRQVVAFAIPPDPAAVAPLLGLAAGPLAAGLPGVLAAGFKNLQLPGGGGGGRQ